MLFDQPTYPLVDLICTLAAGIAGITLALCSRFRANEDMFLCLVFGGTFTGVVSLALGPVPLTMVAALVGVLFGLSLYLVEWLMPLPVKPAGDEDEEEHLK